MQHGGHVVDSDQGVGGCGGGEGGGAVDAGGVDESEPGGQGRPRLGGDHGRRGGFTGRLGDGPLPALLVGPVGEVLPDGEQGGQADRPLGQVVPGGQGGEVVGVVVAFEDVGEHGQGVLGGSVARRRLRAAGR